MWLLSTVVVYEAGGAHAVWINSIVYSCTVMKCLHPILDCMSVIMMCLVAIINVLMNMAIVVC